MLRIFITYLMFLPLWSLESLEEETFSVIKIYPYQEHDYSYCENNPEICKKLNQKQIDLSHLEFVPERKPATKAMWFTFTTLQLLDVYTTERGMRYDCVKELNPLLPTKPSVGQMITLKTFILAPTYYTINEAVTITNRDLFAPSLITGAVVLNNYHVNRRASKNCRKIR